MLDIGSGPPLVLIPGIQGRWEWMKPSIDVLARHYRVITMSLPGEPGVETPFDDAADFDVFVNYVDGVLDAAGVPDAVICGVSFGGLVALRYAAKRSHRVRGLILVSTPGPGWKLRPHLARYARWPTLSSPLFAFGAARRYWRELDLVVPSEESMLYLTLIPGARFELFERTGHLGTVLAPERFAAIVSRFLNG
jgi:pimeloyl-ACP methyl ester carboxylesterase